MGWATARDQVATIVRETVDLLKLRGSPQKFRHIKEGDVDKPLQTRDFWFEIRSGRVRGEVTISPPWWFRYPVDLCIAYCELSDPTALFDLIASDHAALAARLPEQHLWLGATSTIESLFDGEEIMMFDVEAFDDRDVVVVRHHMDWEFRPDPAA